MRLALTLFVLGIGANYHNPTMALNNTTLVTHLFYGRSYLHSATPFFHKIKAHKTIAVLRVPIHYKENF